MTIFLCLVFLGVGYALGVIQQRKARPRHEHYWEVVEKKELPSAVEQSGQTVQELIGAVKKANSYGYAPDTNSVIKLTKQTIVVHYRCPCGAERVEKL